MSVQGRWSHVPSSPLPMVPMTLPLQQQTEGISASNFSHGHPIEQLRANRFSESQTSAPSDSNHAFPVVADAGHSLSPDKLGSEGTSSRISAGTSTNVVTHQSSTGSVTSETGKREAVQNGSNNTSSGLSINSFKPQHSQQYSNTTGYGYQRGGASQRHSSTSDWSHRRMGFNGKNSLGPDKALPNSKVRQIYVAKQTKGSSTTD